MPQTGVKIAHDAHLKLRLEICVLNLAFVCEQGNMTGLQVNPSGKLGWFGNVRFQSGDVR